MSISVLVPVLGRPQNAAPLLASLRATSDAELIFVCSTHDLEQLDACRVAVTLDVGRGGTARTAIVGWQPERDYGRKMNHGYGEAAGEWILLGSDDITFEPGWDTELLRVAAETGKRVIGSNDMANKLVKQGWFSTHPFVHRSFVEEIGGALEGPGFLVSEAYDHNFPDRELACIARKHDEWAFAAQAIVRHHHPAFGGGELDATYERGRSTFFDDQLLFWERSAGWDHVGLLPQEISVLRRSGHRIAKAATARARRERG